MSRLPRHARWIRACLCATLLLCAGALTVSACSNDPPSIACDQDTGASALAGNLAIKYQASATQGGKWTSITYATDTGAVVVANPTLPWEVDVTNAINPARIAGSGTISGTGTLVVEYSADGGEGRTASDQAGCNLNTD